MGRDLHAGGCHALQHPDVMMSYGAKDSLVKLRELPVGLPDTFCYYQLSDILRDFPVSLAQVRGRSPGDLVGDALDTCPLKTLLHTLCWHVMYHLCGRCVHLFGGKLHPAHP